MDQQPDPTGADAGFFRIPDHAGPNYIRFMEVLHRTLRPKTYLEIGTARGDLLRLATCASIAIDPVMELASDPSGGKPRCFLFKQSSDEFFKTENPSFYLKDKIDFAFLDGPHLYEYLLRDFANVERHCRRNSVIFLHDCLPTDAHVARRVSQDMALAGRSDHPDWWAGDVWKAVAILRRYRPDLRIHAFDTPPTGLVAVTNLDPESKLVSEHFFTLIDEAQDAGAEAFQAYLASLKVLEASKFSSAEALAGLFWV